MSRASYSISWPNLRVSGRATRQVFYSHPTYGRRQVVSRDRVHVSAAELISVVAHAVHAEKSWLHDFSHETIEISQDLFGILVAYQQQIVYRAA